MLQLPLKTIRIEPADVFVTRSPSLLGKLIRRFQRSRGEAPSVVNHIGIFTERGTADTARTLEALWHTRHMPFSDWLKDHNGTVWVFRNTRIPTIVRDYVAKYAVKTYPAGLRYGWWKLPLHLLGLKSLLRFRRRPICSLLVGDAYEEVAAYRFRPPSMNEGIKGMELQPDDAWDAMMGQSEWLLVATIAGGKSKE